MLDTVMSRAAVYSPVITMLVVNFGFSLLNVLLKKILDLGLNPLVFITYRLIISTFFLSPIGYFWERKNRPKLTLQILFYLFCSAVVGTSLTQYLCLLGLQYTSATFACAFINLIPIITFVMALPFGLETVNIRSNGGRAKVLGTLLCVGGVLLLTLYRGTPLFSHHHSSQTSVEVKDNTMKLMSTVGKRKRWRMGSVAMVIGSLLMSSWYLVQSKLSQNFPCQVTSTALISFFGAIQSAIICLATSAWRPSMWVLKGKLEIFTVLYAGIVGSGLCFVGMSWCVKKRGPVFTAAFSPLIQIMAAMVDIPVLHEQLHLGSLLGSLIVILGLYILLWGKNKEILSPSTKTTPEDEQNTKEEDPQLRNIHLLENSHYP